MLIYKFIGLFIFVRGLLVFSMKRKHVLLILLILIRLEFIVLSVHFIIFIYLIEFLKNCYDLLFQSFKIY